MVEKNIVYCGIDCAQCPIYVATKTDDDELRQKTAKEYGLDRETIYCNMCNSDDEIVFFWCAECPIRSCARERGYITCSECAEYPCEKMAEQHAKYPEQRETLDEIRKSLS